MTYKPVTKIILALSIAVILNLLFNYSVNLIFENPKYDDYFPRVTEHYQNQEVCEAEGYDWIKNPQQPKMVGVENPEVYMGYCDTYSKNQEIWETDSEKFERKAFISLITLGVVVIVLSVIFKNPVVSLGLTLGAFLDFIIASTRYWRYSDEFLKVGILVVALAALIWLAIKKFGDN